QGVAPGDGVLVDIVADGLDGGFLDEVRGGEVGEALGEIDGVVLHRQPGHLADDALGELFDALGDAATRRNGGGSRHRGADSYSWPDLRRAASSVDCTGDCENGSSWPGINKPAKRSISSRERRNSAWLCGGMS